MPAISVIIPLYNKQTYLERLFDSISSQVLTDFEVILIDDGSTDESGQMADIFSAKNPHVYVQHTENNGVSHARNLGLSQAQGEYITFIDADDTVAPDYLSNLYKKKKKENADLVISGVTKTNSRGAVIDEIRPPYTGKTSFEHIKHDFAKMQNDTGIYGTCVGKIFLRSLCDGIWFDEEISLAEDLDFYIRLLHRVQSIYFDDKCLYYYVQNAENSSTQLDDQQIDYISQARIQLRMRSFLQSRMAYEGENKAIVDRRITDYCYYAIRYTNIDTFFNRFHDLRELFLSEKPDLSENGMEQRILLHLLKSGCCRTAYFCVLVSNNLRKLLIKIR